MRVQSFLLCLLIAAGAASLPAVSEARTDISVGIAFGPPAPAVAYVPPPRAGYVWAPGYWRWNGYRYVWVSGRWLGARPGFVWVAERWVPRGPRWHFVPGYWVREYPRRHWRY